MTTPKSTLLVFAAACTLITVAGWVAPPKIPPWQLVSLAVLVTVLAQHGPEALTRLVHTIAELAHRSRR